MKINHISIIFLLIPLILSAYTHLWNPVGFPDIFYDEGIYMYRAMNVLAGDGPQVGTFHDHPFFGQMFLAGTLAITGYPNSLHPTPDTNSVKMLYLVPRVLMGILAIVDTFLIYKISEYRYSKNVALLSSLLFAVMPITWLVRRILLDSILLPFLLSSILFALYTRDSQNRRLSVIISGILLGITIFTKETAFTMIPLVAVMVYQNTKNRRMLAMWFIPVILIPLLWPIQSLEDNQFQYFVRDLLIQVHRENHSFGQILGTFFAFDPILLLLGLAGTVYACLKRDTMILLWMVPFLIFLASIGYVQYFYWIPVLPIFCIAAAKLIVDRITIKKVQRITPFVMAGLGISGLIISSMLITSDVSAQFEAAAYVLQNFHNSNISSDKSNTSIVSSPVYSWMFTYVFHVTDTLSDYRAILFHPIPTDKVLLIADHHFMANINAGKQLQDIYNNTRLIKEFKGGVLKYDLRKYPFTNMAASYDGGEIEIRESK